MSEQKLYEKGDLAVTTDRFFTGSEIIPIEEITNAQPAQIEDFAAPLILAGIGLAMIIWGGIIWKIGGALLAVFGYKLYKSSIKHLAFVYLRSEETKTFEFKDAGTPKDLTTAIREAVAKYQQQERLRENEEPASC